MSSLRSIICSVASSENVYPLHLRDTLITFDCSRCRSKASLFDYAYPQLFPTSDHVTGLPKACVCHVLDGTIIGV